MLLSLAAIAARAATAEPAAFVDSKELQGPACPLRPKSNGPTCSTGSSCIATIPAPAALTYPNFDAGKFADCALAQDANMPSSWPSTGPDSAGGRPKTTKYGVGSAPWKDGKGNVFGEVVKACRARGLKVGFYLSPTDEHFGARVSGITADPARQQAYNDYYCTQLTELCFENSRPDGRNLVRTAGCYLPFATA